MKTRKILAAVMVAVLSLCMLVGCSSKDSVTGKWSMTKAKYSEIEQDASTLGLAMMLEFSDGKVKISTNNTSASGDSTTGESKYKLDGNTVTITDEDGTEMKATVNGDTMTLTQNGVEFTLIKDDGKAFEGASSGNNTEATPAATAGNSTEATPAATAE